MSVAPLLRKIFMVDLIKGLRVTFRYQNPKEIYTEQYPLERPDVGERYRGVMRLKTNPATGETLCNGCGACALACPEKLITITSERNPATKKKEMISWQVDMSRCMFCALCEEACPSAALELSQDYEFAVYSRDFVLDRERLEKGPEPTEYKR